MKNGSKTITIALAGNPNSGKTTLFNSLTGSRQHVGNYPGVTVEKKEGYREHKGFRIKVVDLPGTYSLTAHSIEELIARNFVIEEKPDVVVDIVDATNLERNLYLAVQFMELGARLVVALNMSDLAKARGYEIDRVKLSALLGAAVVPTVATKGEGMSQLLDAVVSAAPAGRNSEPVRVKYGREIEEELSKLSLLLDGCPELAKEYGSRWLAVKLLENDNEVRGKIRRECHNGEEILSAVERSSRHLEGVFGDAPEIVIADRRYGFISGACRESVRTTVQSRYDMSEKIDSILTSRVIGLPLFFGLMYVVFQFTFALGEPLTGLIEHLLSHLGRMLSGLWPTGSESALKSLIVDGVIGGVGAVLSFLPNVMLLFLAIAILEDSGYMARAAFIMDRVMHKVGLHGKSFIPMLIGFGCSVPAVMATRTLENRADRLTTIMVIPLISCGARLTIYALIIPAFFAPGWRAPILWIIYLIGILLAMAGARLIRSTLLKGEATPFVMELPPYRMPTLRGVAIHMWERASLYIRKAGTIILGVSVVLWALMSYPKSKEVEEAYEKKVVEAKQTYLGKAGMLNVVLGLDPDADALVRLAAVEMEAEIGESKAPGDGRRRERVSGRKEEDRVRELTGGKDGEVISGFLEAIRTLERSGTSSPQRLTGQTTSQRQPRSKAGNVAPHTGYAMEAATSPQQKVSLVAAHKYLYEVKKPFKETIARLNREKRAGMLARSAAGRIGRTLEPMLKPLGFDWRIGTAFLGAFVAKEVFVAQTGIIFSMGEKELRKSYTPLTAFCIMLFALIATPCVATVAVTRRETGAWKWALLQFGGLTVLAYIVTLAVYQVGSLLA